MEDDPKLDRRLFESARSPSPRLFGSETGSATGRSNFRTRSDDGVREKSPKDSLSKEYSRSLLAILAYSLLWLIPMEESVIGLPMGPQEPQVGPRAVPGLALKGLGAAIHERGESDPASNRGYLAEMSVHERVRRSNTNSLQIVLQELMLNEKGKVQSRLKYVSIRDLYQYIDRLISANEGVAKNKKAGKKALLVPGDEKLSVVAPNRVDSPSTLNPMQDDNLLSQTANGDAEAKNARSFVRLSHKGVSPFRRVQSASHPSAFVRLHPRDLRKLSVNYSISNNASIIVRKHVLLLNFDPLRAIVLHDRLLLLVPDGADSVLLKIEYRLEELCKPFSTEIHSALDHDEQTAFELNAVEAILSTVSTIISEECRKLEPIVSDTLQALHTNNLHYAQDRLKFVKNTIDAETTRIETMKSAVLEVLDDDVDMAMMQLSKIRENPEEYSIPIAQEVIEDHDSVEILLEAYLQSFATLQTKLQVLDQQIDNTEESVILKLDLARNRLLTVDTMIAVVSCGFAFGSMVAGLFGMNLRNGKEDSLAAFHWVVTATVLFIVVLVGLMSIYLFKAGLLNI